MAKQVISQEDDGDIRLLRYYRLTGEISYRNQIILNNYKLILKWAHKHAATPDDFNNILPEAVLGFIDGIEKFDLKKRVGIKNMKLSSYCAIRMRKTICRHLEENGRLVRVPWRHISEAKRLLKRNAVMEFGTPLDMLAQERSSVTVLGVLEVLNGAPRDIESGGATYPVDDFEPRALLGERISYRQWLAEPELERDIDPMELLQKCPSITDKERSQILAHYGIKTIQKALCPATLQNILARVRAWAQIQQQ